MNHCPSRSLLSIPLLLAFCAVPVFAEATELARGFHSALDAQAAVNGAQAQQHEP